MVRRLLCLVPFLLATAAAAHAQADAQASLQGISKIEVVVESLSGDAAQIGVTEQRLRTLAEGKLLAEGMEVADFALAFVYLNVTAVQLGDSPNFALYIEFSFNQPSASTLNQWLGPARTWSAGRLVVVGESAAAETVFRNVEHLVDAFLEDWNAANG
jgi:hypothetical protein